MSPPNGPDKKWKGKLSTEEILQAFLYNREHPVEREVLLGVLEARVEGEKI